MGFFPPFLLSTLLISLAKLSLIGLGPHITFIYFLQACLWYGKGYFFSLFCSVCPILSIIFYLQFSLKLVHFGILLNLKQVAKLKEVEARDQELKVNLCCTKNLKPAWPTWGIGLKKCKKKKTHWVTQYLHPVSRVTMFVQPQYSDL